MARSTNVRWRHTRCGCSIWRGVGLPLSQAVSASVNAPRVADCHRERIGIRARLGRHRLADRGCTDPAEPHHGACFSGAGSGISDFGIFRFGVAIFAGRECGVPTGSVPGFGAPGFSASYRCVPDSSVTRCIGIGAPVTDLISPEPRRAGHQPATGRGQWPRIECATIERGTGRCLTRGGQPGCRTAVPCASRVAAGGRAAGRCPACPRGDGDACGWPPICLAVCAPIGVAQCDGRVASRGAATLNQATEVRRCHGEPPRWRLHPADRRLPGARERRAHPGDSQQA